MNDKTVILDHDQWLNCWREMCDDLEYVPAWDQYDEYFGSVECEQYLDDGLEITFMTAVEAMAFKLRWS